MPSCMVHAVFTAHLPGTLTAKQFCLAGGCLFCTEEDPPYMKKASQYLPLGARISYRNRQLKLPRIVEWALPW
ncbi:Uncharacterized protein PBTT_10242 [Plasmodiophora brassicae]